MHGRMDKYICKMWFVCRANGKICLHSKPHSRRDTFISCNDYIAKQQWSFPGRDIGTPDCLSTICIPIEEGGDVKDDATLNIRQEDSEGVSNS